MYLSKLLFLIMLVPAISSAQSGPTCVNWGSIEQCPYEQICGELSYEKKDGSVFSYYVSSEANSTYLLEVVEQASELAVTLENHDYGNSAGPLVCMEINKNEVKQSGLYKIVKSFSYFSIKN